MNHSKLLIAIMSLTSIVLFTGCAVVSSNAEQESSAIEAAAASPDNLAVLWTSGDPYVAQKVCFMYTHNAKKQNWFKRVQLIVWGPSAKLLADDTSLQEAVKNMMADGVEVKACKACADSYGISDDLASLGIEVRYMGVPLTRMLKSADWSTLTF